MNEFADRAREKKAAELVQMIDKEVFSRGMKPAGTPEEIEAVIDVVMAYTPEDWAAFACALKRKTKASPPSEETIAMVLRTYQHRAEAALIDEDPFARTGLKDHDHEPTGPIPRRSAPLGTHTRAHAGDRQQHEPPPASGGPLPETRTADSVR